MYLSIVVPVYNSADCLGALVERFDVALRHLGDSYEVLLVDDDSRDASWQTIVELSGRYSFVAGVRLRRNAGQDNAIMAGLLNARGEVVVVMDDDLQHDPADVPTLCSALEKGGNDVMYGRFPVKQQAFWKNAGSWLNDRVAVAVLGKPKNIYMSPFKAMRGDLAAEIVKYDGPFSYVDGLIFTVTSNIGQVDVAHHTRYAGESNYGLVKSIRVWLKLATNFSIVPLRLATLMGALMSIVAFGLGVFFLIQSLVLSRMPEGWPSLMLTVLFLGGIELVGIGALGEYIGRIYITQNKRPQFTIRDRCGAAPAPPARSALDQ